MCWADGSREHELGNAANAAKGWQPDANILGVATYPLPFPVVEGVHEMGRNIRKWRERPTPPGAPAGLGGADEDEGVGGGVGGGGPDGGGEGGPQGEPERVDRSVLEPQHHHAARPLRRDGHRRGATPTKRRGASGLQWPPIQPLPPNQMASSWTVCWHQRIG